MTEGGKKAIFFAEMALAEEFLAKARHDSAGGFHRGAVSASYYSAFHAARAALSILGVEAKSHEGVQQLFSLHFIKPGQFPREDGRLLRRMQKDREDADYAIYSEFGEDDASEAIEGATSFLARVQALPPPT